MGEMISNKDAVNQSTPSRPSSALYSGMESKISSTIRSYLSEFTEPRTSATSRIVVLYTDASAIDISSCEVSSVVDNFLTADEKHAALRFMSVKDKQMALGSRLLTRFCLSSIARVEHHHIEINRSAGKPVWIWNESTMKDMKTRRIPYIYFNVSHDYGRVSIALSDAGSVGIDVMKAETRPTGRSQEEFFKVHRQTFTDSEWSFIRGGDRDGRGCVFGSSNPVARFMALWTMKEAFVKALGTGLYIEPKRLEACTPLTVQDVSETKIRLDGVIQSNTYFRHSLNEGFVTCVCMVCPYSASVNKAYRNLLPPHLLPAQDVSADSVVEQSLDVFHLISELTQST